jgi:anti-sigma factor RsiW
VEYPPGWTCEKTVLQFEYYFVSRLKLADALAVAEHLEACPACAHQLVLFRMTAGRLSRA